MSAELLAPSVESVASSTVSTASFFSGEFSTGSHSSINIFGSELSVLSTPSSDTVIKSADWMYPKSGFIDIPRPTTENPSDLFSLPNHSVGSARFSPEGRVFHMVTVDDLSLVQDIAKESPMSDVVDQIISKPSDFVSQVDESAQDGMSVTPIEAEPFSVQREIVFQDEDRSSHAEIIDPQNEIVVSGEDAIKIDQPDVSTSEVEQIMTTFGVGTLLAEMSVESNPALEEGINDADTANLSIIKTQPEQKISSEEVQTVDPQIEQMVDTKLAESSVIVLPSTEHMPFVLARENVQHQEVPVPSYEEQKQLFQSIVSDSTNVTEEEMKAQLLAYLKAKGYKELYAQIAEEQLVFRLWLFHQAVDLTFDSNEKIGEKTASGAEVLSTLGRDQDKREQSPITLPGQEDGSGQKMRIALSQMPEMTRADAHKVVDLLSDLYPTGKYSDIMTAPPISDSNVTIIRSPQRSKSDMVTREPGLKAA